MTIGGRFGTALLLILGLSLAANFVVAGFIAARFAGPSPPGEIERVVAIGMRAFPKELREAIDRRVRQERDQLRRHYDALRDARQRMIAAMRSEPFDPVALEAAYADVRDQTIELQAIGQNMVAEALAQASPQTRRKILLRRGPPGR